MPEHTAARASAPAPKSAYCSRQTQRGGGGASLTRPWAVSDIASSSLPTVRANRAAASGVSMATRLRSSSRGGDRGEREDEEIKVKGWEEVDGKRDKGRRMNAKPSPLPACSLSSVSPPMERDAAVQGSRPYLPCVDLPP